MKFRVIKHHQAAGGPSRELESGERLQFERRPSEYEGWVWCTAEDGGGGWVPETWLTITQDPAGGATAGWCFLKRDYSPEELTVHPGDILEGRREESGWLWACTADGRKGWVPRDAVEPV
ncbi:MAG TPA: SH3 domain-containing protein [candidate division Zixibacteria bacterium]|nr:SH3 domain-containing protein [candidate division Zixibacteria bacterium]MDD4918250.1 SH3 domain-containing protein [candidate division Zixibacteria bacterium]MDM7973991.1 SH3 domain-containing protein [candidate division Zixibacteria bacterium]HOD66518.1 SH3 domain-containing protein [candidate division Zixibacteria bacterium]HOZ06653.1 SH3 domain-containing protein [candidate division Zixibacteria bacterium]